MRDDVQLALRSALLLTLLSASDAQRGLYAYDSYASPGQYDSHVPADIQYEYENPDTYDYSNGYSQSSPTIREDDYLYDYDYPHQHPVPTRLGLRNRGLGTRNNYRYHNRQPHMAHYAKSYPKPKKEFVPVIIKKKKQKKKKILTTHHGFFIRGGTAMFGKFKDLHSCEKACEITPTCFAGDFNPWLGKCFLHSNLTACASMSSHKAITHFKKVPCDVTETNRGTVVLGASTLFGIEIKGIDTLQDCIKKCVTAGGGIAPSDDTVADTPQICCNIDYDFATHKCFMHACINEMETDRFCIGDNIEAPVNSVPNPSTITITFCPRAETAPAPTDG